MRQHQTALSPLRPFPSWDPTLLTWSLEASILLAGIRTVYFTPSPFISVLFWRGYRIHYNQPLLSHEISLRVKSLIKSASYWTDTPAHGLSDCRDHSEPCG